MFNGTRVALRVGKQLNANHLEHEDVLGLVENLQHHLLLLLDGQAPLLALHTPQIVPLLHKYCSITAGLDTRPRQDKCCHHLDVLY